MKSGSDLHNQAVDDVHIVFSWDVKSGLATGLGQRLPNRAIFFGCPCMHIGREEADFLEDFLTQRKEAPSGSLESEIPGVLSIFF